MVHKYLNIILSGWFFLLLFQVAPCFSYQFEAPVGKTANTDSQEMQRKRAELQKWEAKLKKKENELRRREGKVDASDSRTPQKPQTEDELAVMRKQLEQLKTEAASAAEQEELDAKRQREQDAQRAHDVHSTPVRAVLRFFNGDSVE